MRKIVIVGAGAMGCLFAARLVEGGHDVTLVDVDESRLAVLGRDGITLSDDQGKRSVPVKAMVAPKVIGPIDLVLLFTKGMHSADAVRSVAHLANGKTFVLTLQNGLGNADIIAAVFDPNQILMGVTDVPADLTLPATVSSHGHGHIWIGNYVGEAAFCDSLRAVESAFNHSNLATEIVSDIRVPIWEKVAFNAALNPLATILQVSAGRLSVQPARSIISAILTEVVVTAKAHGVTLDQASIIDKVNFALANQKDHKPSMLQDRIAGRATEIEFINGAIARAAQEKGIAVPVTETLANLIRVMENRE
ncbi:ketopantoate reductase family protein [Kordiimonas pumila]|uniref:2-dehydropantoate 2-reductase n=1 Tax=Kordiimonas pumila TaxID=2161677 RepID=A0ABV7D5E0_9PROT|nr:2-dehydropantoate 2-reductase [Kordiimonas pumila]